jgi:hypothetical protein
MYDVSLWLIVQMSTIEVHKFDRLLKCTKYWIKRSRTVRGEKIVVVFVADCLYVFLYECFHRLILLIRKSGDDMRVEDI